MENLSKDKKCDKVCKHCHYPGKFRGAPHAIGNLRYKIPKRISVVFRNGSNYDYHFIIKELREKYITFSIPIKKGNKNNKTVTYKTKFIDSIRFMSI